MKGNENHMGYDEACVAGAQYKLNHVTKPDSLPPNINPFLTDKVPGFLWLITLSYSHKRIHPIFQPRGEHESKSINTSLG